MYNEKAYAFSYGSTLRKSISNQTFISCQFWKSAIVPVLADIKIEYIIILDIIMESIIVLLPPLSYFIRPGGLRLVIILRNPHRLTSSMPWVKGQSSQSRSGNLWMIAPEAEPLPERTRCHTLLVQLSIIG